MCNDKNCISFGIAQKIITPKKSMFPLELKGFAARTELTTEVLDDIFVKALLLRKNKDLLLIALDLTIISTEVSDEIKQMINKKYALSPDQIIIVTTHSHSSVILPSNIEGYNEYAYELIMNAVDECFKNVENGYIYFTKGHSNVGVSRRLKTPTGEIKFAPSWDTEIDREMFILKVTDENSNIKGIVYNLPCHGTCLGPLSLVMCNDFMGFTNRFLEERYEGAVSLFLPANGADVKPVESALKEPDGDYLKDRFITCTPEQAEAIGKSVADEITDILNNNEFISITPEFKTSSQLVQLFGPKPDFKDAEKKFMKFKDIRDKELAETGQSTHMTDYSYNRFKKHYERLTSGNYSLTVSVPFSEWYLGSNVKMIAIACEPSTQLGIMIKNIFNDGRTMILGYANGTIGYICNSVQHQEGGYEAESLINRGLAGPLPAESDSLICNAVKALHFDLKG